MNSDLTDELYCSTYGHNFYHSKSIDASNDELVCKHCNKKIISNSNSDLEHASHLKDEFRALLLQLYTLKRPNFLSNINLKF